MRVSTDGATGVTIDVIGRKLRNPSGGSIHGGAVWWTGASGDANDRPPKLLKNVSASRPNSSTFETSTEGRAAGDGCGSSAGPPAGVNHPEVSPDSLCSTCLTGN